MNFLTDGEKLVDFFALSKIDFLYSYSYLTEAEYDDTFKCIMRFIEENKSAIFEEV
ncbi:MAG: hypothetical protein MJ230_07185 [bacterium]|nr:hypothetical protein [bacterium]